MSKIKRGGSRWVRRKRWTALLYELQGGLCMYCLREMSWDDQSKLRATFDHRVPLSLGGADSIENGHAACYECNNRKKNLTDVEMFHRLALRTPRRARFALAVIDCRLAQGIA